MGSRRVVALAGGVGAARFLAGLVRVVPPAEITVIVNTGDDRDFFGLRVCPDLDIITYTLAGCVRRDTGWGIEGDTGECLRALSRFRSDTWFELGASAAVCCAAYLGVILLFCLSPSEREDVGKLFAKLRSFLPKRTST